MPESSLPTEFPAADAARIGRAILTRSWSIDLVEPAYRLIGYALSMLVNSTGWTVGSPLDIDEPILAAMLVEAGEAGEADNHVVASGAPGVDVASIPWSLLLPILFRLLEKHVR